MFHYEDVAVVLKYEWSQSHRAGQLAPLVNWLIHTSLRDALILVPYQFSHLSMN